MAVIDHRSRNVPAWAGSGGDEGRSRTLPHDQEAEESVLGSMLMATDSFEAIGDVLQILHADDFYRPAHRVVYESIMRLFAAGQPVDAVTVAADLEKMGELEKAGGRPAIFGIVDSTPSYANAAYYARIVEERSLLRRLIRASSEISQMAFEGGQEINTTLDRAEGLIFEVAQRRVADTMSPVQDLLNPMVAEIEKLHEHQSDVLGLPTGFRDFDSLTSGLHKDNLIIVAARPAVGKSTFALNVAAHAALAGHGVAYFSLEMSKTELVQRLLCSTGGIDAQRIRNRRLTDRDWFEITRAADRLQRAPLWIDDSAITTALEMRAKCRRLAARGDLSLVVVDYMQLMHSHTKSENRQQEVSDISRNLKILARELNVPVIAVSQLNRGVEARADKRPMLGDLRESGSLEQDADLVVFLYRDEYYDRDSRDKGVAEVIVAKHRNGPTGEVRLAYLAHQLRFGDLGREQG